MCGRAFFGTLYRCLARGARAVLQLYAENMDQSEMIMSYAMRSGFAGGMVVDWPHRYGVLAMLMLALWFHFTWKDPSSQPKFVGFGST